MSNSFISIFVLALLIGTVSLVLISMFFVPFVRYPLQITLRILLAMHILLVMTLAIPDFEGEALLSLDWGWILRIESHTLQIKIGMSTLHYLVAFVSVSSLMALCLLCIGTEGKNLLQLFSVRLRDLTALKHNMERLTEGVQSDRDQQNQLQTELHTYLIAQSMGIDISAIPVSRFIPVRVYLDDDDEVTISIFDKSIREYLNSIGFVVAYEFPEQIGSWFKKLIAKTKEPETQEAFLERLEKAERALELGTLQIRQSEVDRNQAEAASKLIESIRDVPNAVCQIGSLVVVKLTDRESKISRLFTRTLSPKEMIFIEKNPNICGSPEDLLEALDQFSSQSIEGDSSRSDTSHEIRDKRIES